MARTERVRRVLCLVPSLGAAIRYRLIQFFPMLDQEGFHCTLSSFLSPAGYAIFYKRGLLARKLLYALLGFLRRLGDLLRAIQADIVVVQREAAPFGPAIFEWIIGRILRRPVIYDIDDPVFVPYVSPTYGALLSRLKFPGKTRTLVRISRKVICASQYVLRYVQSAGNDGIIIPTIVDTNVFKPLHRPPRDLPVIGWVGSHSTAQYLKLIAEAMQRLAHRRAFLLRVVGAERLIVIEGVHVENVEWTLDGELGFFQGLDIGVYPIIEDDWSRGKTGFKAIQYMSVGVPPVCSPVGEVPEVVEDGVTGFLAATTEEWVDRLDQLLSDPDLRARMGSAGRRAVEEQYSIDRWGPVLVRVMQEAVEGRKVS